MTSLVKILFTVLLISSESGDQTCPEGQDPVTFICSAIDIFHSFTPFSETSVDFLIWTNSNSMDDDYETVRPFSDDIHSTALDPENPTYVLFHGLAEKATQNWILNAKTQILSVQSANIISIRAGGEDSVGWVSDRTYGLTLCKGYKIGNYTAHALDWLHQEMSLEAANMHLIGFSLGAHVAGITGHYMKGLSIGQVKRITGLDPAAKHYMKLFLYRCMLDKSQADFVDIIHTNGCYNPICFGIKEAIGHVDFYPNGGEFQRGCSVGPICNHERALSLFVESITSTEFNAWPCDSWENYEAGLCSSCGQGCIPMGFLLETSLEGSYYLTTYSDSPYAKGDNQ